MQIATLSYANLSIIRPLVAPLFVRVNACMNGGGGGPSTHLGRACLQLLQRQINAHLMAQTLKTNLRQKCDECMIGKNVAEVG